MNYSDTERMETYIEALGFKKTNQEDDADFVIFNTCSIRKKAEDRALGKAAKLTKSKYKGRDILIAVTGCMARISSSKYSEKRDKLFNTIKELDIVFKINELQKLAGLIREINPDSEIKEIPEESLEHYFQIDPTYSTSSENQAFLPISMGCDKFCTYCIVPYSRGREQSRPMDEILKEAQQLVKDGFKEITLIGQTVNSYGLSVHDKLNKKFDYITEGKEPFVVLLEKIDKLKDDGLERVRWTSSHPKDMSDQLIDAMAQLETQMPYLHLPVQAGDDTLLKRMNRTYTTEKYRTIIKKLRKKIPGISITTDIIVGFSDESEEEFKNTCEFFKEMQFEHAFLAQYSERSGTFASKKLNDNIPWEVKRERWHTLNDILRVSSKDILSRFVGQTIKVLFEYQEDDSILGRSEHFKTVRIKKTPETLKLIGQIVPIKIISSREWELFGEV